MVDALVLFVHLLRGDAGDRGPHLVGDLRATDAPSGEDRDGRRFDLQLRRYVGPLTDGWRQQLHHLRVVTVVAVVQRRDTVRQADLHRDPPWR